MRAIGALPQEQSAQHGRRFRNPAVASRQFEQGAGNDLHFAMSPVARLAVAGAGLVGQRHIASIDRCADVELAAIVDPRPATKAQAAEIGVPWFESLSDMFRSARPDGVILATPNPAHVETGLECISAGCPVLVEKPIATSVDEAAILVEAARAADIPLQVGHHRRHYPLMREARAVIDAGRLGRLRTVHATCWLYKPDEYFDEAPWRKAAGAGPVFVNLAHDIDSIRYLCGDVASVQAQELASVRGYENEDVAAAVLKFENGAIGTISVSDSVVSPWSRELTARENPVYPPVAQNCYMLGGSHGSLSLPDLTLWTYSGARSWWEPIGPTTLTSGSFDPFVEQLSRFAAVLAGREEPLVSGLDGLKTLQVIEAIQTSAKSGQTVSLQAA